MSSNNNNVNTHSFCGNPIENNAAAKSANENMINPNGSINNVQKTGSISVSYFSGAVPLDSKTIDIYIDNQFVGNLSKGEPPFSLSLTEGSHVFSVKSGLLKNYKNDPPYYFNVSAGQTVKLHVVNNYNYGLAVVTSCFPLMLLSRDCRRNMFGAFMDVQQVS